MVTEARTPLMPDSTLELLNQHQRFNKTQVINKTPWRSRPNRGEHALCLSPSQGNAALPAFLGQPLQGCSGKHRHFEKLGLVVGMGVRHCSTCSLIIH